MEQKFASSPQTRRRCRLDIRANLNSLVDTGRAPSVELAQYSSTFMSRIMQLSMNLMPAILALPELARQREFLKQRKVDIGVVRLGFKPANRPFNTGTQRSSFL